jgi:hypothetical protein
MTPCSTACRELVQRRYVGVPEQDNPCLPMATSRLPL